MPARRDSELDDPESSGEGSGLPHLEDAELDDGEQPEPLGRTARSRAQATFDEASLRYLPPPAGVVAIVAGFLGAQILATILYLVVAAAIGMDLGAPGGPAFHVGTAVGQLSAGQGFHRVMGIDDLPLSATLALAIPGWLGFAAPLPFIARMYGPGIVRLIGLRVKARDAVWALLGVAIQVVAVPGLYALLVALVPETDVSGPARQVIERASDPLGIVCLVLLVGIGAPLFEEIFFRGLTLRMMERRVGTTYAVLGSSVFFAATHLQPLQFPGLVLIGVVCAVCTVRSGRLGPAIWVHLGFNLTSVVLIIGNLAT